VGRQTIGGRQEDAHARHVATLHWSPVQLTWHDGRFDELAAATLYAILELRARVFVVEQRCAYADVDGLDLRARHLWAEDGGRVVAYLRLVPGGPRFAELSISRVVVDAGWRGGGVGKELMLRGVALAGTDMPIRVSAQLHLERFYRELGFARTAAPHDEDGIPHVEMLRPGAA
jgi:ElaA protein